MSPRNYHAKFTGNFDGNWWSFTGLEKTKLEEDYKKSKKIKKIFSIFKRNHKRISDFK